jgi:hypothetical protein
VGYRIAIFPGLLITPVVVACDRALTTLAASGAHTSTAAAKPDGDLSGGPAVLFRRVGADEWDALRERYGSLESTVEGGA